MDIKHHSGKFGEDYAQEFLRKKGYQIVERNFRNKLGEIDIIAIDKDTLVFVEVKTRLSKKYGKPEEAVNLKKLEKIKRTGMVYSLLHPTLPKKLRIDVVAIRAERGRAVSAKIIKVI